MNISQGLVYDINKGAVIYSACVYIDTNTRPPTYTHTCTHACTDTHRVEVKQIKQKHHIQNV